MGKLMRYQNIESKIWHDEKFSKLSPLQQRLFLYLLTCPHGNFLGIFVLKPGYAMSDLNYTLPNYLKDLLELKTVKFDPESNVIWIVNLLEYSQNYGNWNEKHSKGAIKLLKELPKSKLIQEFIKYYKKLFGDESIGLSIGVSIGLSNGVSNPYAISETETETETETEDILSSKKKLDPPPFEEIIKYLNLKTGKNFSFKTKTNQKTIKARWKEGKRFNDFKKVIDIKFSKWATDEKMMDFLRPETLFGPKMDSYLNEKVEADPYKDFQVITGKE